MPAIANPDSNKWFIAESAIDPDHWWAMEPRCRVGSACVCKKFPTKTAAETYAQEREEELALDQMMCTADEEAQGL